MQFGGEKPKDSYDISFTWFNVDQGYEDVQKVLIQNQNIDIFPSPVI